MKYLEILKKFDKAIVSESQKLKEIYDELCKGDTPSNQICNEDEAIDTKKTMCEYVSEDNDDIPMDSDDESDDNSEDTATTADDDSEVTDDLEKADGEKDDDNSLDKDKTSSNNDEKLMSPSEFFAMGEKNDHKKDIKNESDDKVSASSLLEDEPESPEELVEEPAEETPEDVPAEETPDEEPSEETPEDVPAEETPEGVQEDEESVKSWLKSVLEDDKCDGDDCEKSKAKEVPAEETPTSEVSDNDIEEMPKEVSDEDIEADEEAQALQESIQNISAFVKANKRLFIK